MWDIVFAVGSNRAFGLVSHAIVSLLNGAPFFVVYASSAKVHASAHTRKQVRYSFDQEFSIIDPEVFDRKIRTIPNGAGLSFEFTNNSINDFSYNTYVMK